MDLVGSYCNKRIVLLLSSLSSSSDTATLGGAVTTFDFAFKLHTRPHATLDPYFGIGLGAGQCGT